ncbi:protein O-linked-mannose beta-1,2-N-acetylglucosaminyltransferase 1-like [Macrobrachium nipponense]|uniref:protein O-linked-mannose beta-1,2-N-acetylglucosaminyltransferase 1-like n=1 Tax=Macrobrachium nipponense TaxID=159736 RepID=UPI0030C805D1
MKVLLELAIVFVHTSTWTQATNIHPINAEIRDTPALPVPSLRSQLRWAATPPKGHIFLASDTEICPNSLANIDPKFEEKELNKTVKAIFEGSPPEDTISIITVVGRIVANAFVQGVPLALSNKDIRRAAIGVISAVVVHQSSGKILRHYRHPSYSPSGLLKAFIQSLQPGRILVIAGPARYLDEDLKKYLTDLGVDIPEAGFHPKEVRQTSTRRAPVMMITWVGAVGGSTFGSTSRIMEPEAKQGLFQEFYVPKIEDVSWCGTEGLAVPRWSTKSEWNARRELCQKYDGYGSFCSCPPVPPEPVPRINERIPLASEFLVVVMASRPTALHRLLVSLAEAGTNRSNILVFTSEVSEPELGLVCQAHGVFHEWTGRASDCNGLHRARLYESGLRAAHILRPQAQFFLVLEDDMLVEPDVFGWLTKARQNLEGDDRFICINTISLNDDAGNNNSSNSGSNSNDANNSKGDSSSSSSISVDKGEKFMPGWAASRRVLEAMLRFWPLAKRDLQWTSLLDYWAGDTPCLPPPRSYVRHAAAGILTLGADLSPVFPEEASRSEHMLRPFVIRTMK